jgi:putative salt-induced outer membrane protein YdiY
MIMNIKFLNVLLSLLVCGAFAMAEEGGISTNQPEAVEAMMVEAEKQISDTDEEAEKAEIEAIARQDEKKKVVEKKKVTDPWEAFVPPPDAEFDWIQLTSGEWLKGDFKVLYDYVIEFDSDEMDLQKFDIDDVKRLRTRRMQSVLIEGEDSRRETAILRGLLEINGDRVVLRRSEHEVEITRDKVISIAAGRQRELDYWSGMLSIGANARRGNTETTDATAKVNLKRRTSRSRFTADYVANFSSTDDKESVNNHRLSGEFDRYLTAKLFWQLFAAEYFKDRFSNIDGQYSFSTGVGYEIIYNSRTEWEIGAGVGYQLTQFDSVEEGEDDSSSSPFGTAGTLLDHEVTGNLDFLYDYSFRVLNEENGRYTHHMIVTLSFDLFKDFDLDISYVWDRIDKPQPKSDGSIPDRDDYQTIVSIAYEF